MLVRPVADQGGEKSAMARRAILGALPDERDWPYDPSRSDITESDGSSSMATVCGAALSLMAAGVP